MHTSKRKSVAVPVGRNLFRQVSIARRSSKRVQSAAEELANSLTHGIGLLLSTAGLIALIYLAFSRGSSAHMTSAWVFGGSLVGMYAASTLYHGARKLRLKRILRIVDHIAIFFLIAGSYTPFLLVHFEGLLQTVLLITIWALALIGTAFKLFFTGRFVLLSTSFYVLMGWLIVLALDPLLAVIPFECALWLLSGGLLYTGGVAFFIWERLPYNHAIWHLFVIGGSTCHYAAVVLYVMPF